MLQSMTSIASHTVDGALTERPDKTQQHKIIIINDKHTMQSYSGCFQTSSFYDKIPSMKAGVDKR